MTGQRLVSPTGFLSEPALPRQRHKAAITPCQTHCNLEISLGNMPGPGCLLAVGGYWQEVQCRVSRRSTGNMQFLLELQNWNIHQHLSFIHEETGTNAYISAWARRETTHHGDFTDFLHCFPGAPQKCVIRHSLTGTALDLASGSD